MICGVLAPNVEVMGRVMDALGQEFGAIELVSPIWPFEMTTYYRDEIGPDILRQFAAFEGVFAMDELAAVKLTTNAMELRLSREFFDDAERRRINIDPGYVQLNALALASTKPQAHRIYLGRGIYAEVTLLYERGGWRSNPRTYRDYASDQYHAFLTQVRERVKKYMREGASTA